MSMMYHKKFVFDDDILLYYGILLSLRETRT